MISKKFTVFGLFNEIDQNPKPKNTVQAKESNQNAQVSEKQLTTCCGVVAKSFGFSDDLDGFDIIAISMQKGGVNTKQGSGKSNRNKVNIPFMFGPSGAMKEISTSKVNSLLLSQISNIKIRQFARTFASRIMNRSKSMAEPGFLVKQLTTNYKAQWDAIEDPDKQYWAADFQHDNPDCPEEIRDLLKLRYQDRYRPFNKRSYNTTE